MIKKIAVGVVLLGLVVAFAYGLRPRRAVTTLSNEAYEEYYKGVNLQNKFYFNEAFVHFERAVELDSNFAMAYCRQGLIHWGFGRIEAARKALAKAVDLAPKTTEKEQLIIAFHHAHTNREYDKAEEMIQKLARRYPQAIEPYDYRGDEYFRKREYEKGIEEYNRLIEIDPNYALAYNQLGYAHAFLGNFDEAVNNLKKYVFLAPDQPNPHDSLGEIYLLMGRYDEAITMFNKARQLKSDFAFAIDHLGTAYRQKGMYRKAVKYFEKSLALCTNQWCKVDKLIEIARIHYEKSDHDSSLAILEQIPAQGPQLFIVKWLEGLNYIDQGKIEEAILQKEQMEDLLANESTQEGIDERRTQIDMDWLQKYFLHLSGEIELDRNVYDKAIENFYNIFAITLQTEEDIFFRTALAEALYKGGELEKAIAELESVFKINPNYAPSRYISSRVFEELGNFQKASSEMEKYLFILDGCDEGLPKVKDIRNRLNSIKEST